MQQQQIKYIYTIEQLECLILKCVEYCSAEISDAKHNQTECVQAIDKVYGHINRILHDNLLNKGLKNETMPVMGNLDTRMQMSGVDPINEVIGLHVELFYLRYLFNELVISDDKFKEVLNEASFEKARQFSAEQIRARFPMVQHSSPNISQAQPQDQNKPEEKIEEAVNPEPTE